MTGNPYVLTPLAIARAVRELGDVFTWTFDVPGGFAFRPGQFNMLYVHGVGEVPISISGDPAHPELDGTHRIEYVMDNTDPALFGWEIDILHNFSGRVRFLNATTHEPDISVWGLAQAQNRRVTGWHIKDGFRNTAQITLRAPVDQAGLFQKLFEHADKIAAQESPGEDDATVIEASLRDMGAGASAH